MATVGVVDMQRVPSAGSLRRPGSSAALPTAVPSSPHAMMTQQPPPPPSQQQQQQQQVVPPQTLPQAQAQATSASAAQQQQQQQQQQQDKPEIVIEDRIRSTGEHIHRKYLKGKLLGKGGFAKCFEFTDLQTSTLFAGKVVEKSSLKKPRAKQKLLSEIKIHRSMDHPYVVRFDRFFEDKDNVYILLELCHNKSMMELVRRRRRLTEPEAAFYMVQLIDAVKYMHKNKVIHRDLKLGNLFLTKNLEIRIGDFGLACALSFDGERRRTVCGTPNYIAPEILESKNGHGYEVDIWSIGVILYTYLIGKPPFETTDVKTTYRRIKANQYTFPEGVPISENAKNLIRSILVTAPEDRPSLDDILAHPWFTTMQIPRSLPQSALTTAPRFATTITPAGSVGAEGSSASLPRQLSSNAAFAPVAFAGNGAADIAPSGAAAAAAAAAAAPASAVAASANGVSLSTAASASRLPLSELNAAMERATLSERHRFASVGQLGDKASGVAGVSRGAASGVAGAGTLPSRARSSASMSSSTAGNNGLQVDSQLGPARRVGSGEQSQPQQGPATPPNAQMLARLSSVGAPSALLGVPSAGLLASEDALTSARSAAAGSSGALQAELPPSGAASARLHSVRSVSDASSALPPVGPTRAQQQHAAVHLPPTPSRSSFSTAPSSVPAALGAPGETVQHPPAQAAGELEAAGVGSLPGALPSMADDEDRRQLGDMHQQLEASVQQQQLQQQQQPQQLAGAAAAAVPRGEAPPQWVTKWVDYSNKYGLGYQLCNDTVGVYFNDATKIILAADGETVEYIDVNRAAGGSGREECRRFGLSNYPPDLHKKVTLLKHFRNYLCDNGAENQQAAQTQPQNIGEGAATPSGASGTAAAAASSSSGAPSVTVVPTTTAAASMPYVKKWLRTRHAIIFRLSNKVVQVNFFDHTKLVLSSEAQMATYINKRREKTSHCLATVINNPCTELIHRLKYTKDILYQLITKQAKA